MTRFGIFCPPAIGHLNPMCAIALELRRRNYEVVFFGFADALQKLKSVDIDTHEIIAQEFPAGSLDQSFKALGQLSGKAGLKFSIDLFKQEAEVLFRAAPKAIKEERIDFLIIDQVTTAVAIVADLLEIPFATVCNAMPVNREPAIPPFSFPWLYSKSKLSHFRNSIGNILVNLLTRDLWNTVSQQRQDWGLPSYKSRSDAYSKLVQICQLPIEFDFPREEIPAYFHYIGRFEDVSGTEPIKFSGLDFPFERLNDKPLIYASLGTLQNQRPEIFECIARACSSLEAQLVISLGNPTAAVMDLPGDPIVVPFAPHQELIKRANVVVTHAGMNTVLTSLSCGVPLVAIPITNEQPGIGARLAYSKAGRTLSLNKLNDQLLRETITEVLTNPAYKANAQAMQNNICKAGGVTRAVDILEEAARTRQPVLRPVT